jgi:pimeloyl-ACP methyl ester carboxylesterase
MTAESPAVPLDLAAPWGGRSHVTDLGGPVHWVDFGGPDGADGAGGADGADGAAGALAHRCADTIVLVHGLGGSHLNWVQLAPALTERHRVVAIDLAGFGLTPGHGRPTSVHANADLLARFVDEVVGGPVVLVGNSMGGMVSLLLAAGRPELVRGLVLVDPSVPTERHRPERAVALQFLLHATPVVGERVVARMGRRFTDRQQVQRTVDLCFADPARMDPRVLEATVALTAHRRSLPGLEAAYVAAARSLLRVLRSGGRYAALIRSVKVPVLLVHGELDRLVPVAAARRAAADNPAWTTAFLDGVGHTPQLEAPARVLEHLRPWLHALSACPERGGGRQSE